MPQPFNINVASYMSNLMYSFKYGMKDKYYKTLERLKPFMDDDLYNWYYNFGSSQLWVKGGRVHGY